MSLKSLYDFNDYKDYLTSLWGGSSVRSGVKQKVAQFIGCQPAYVSQVLNKDSHFNLEQGQKISEFLNHSEDEMNFFLLLIQMNRAGTQSLKKFFEKQIREIRLKRKPVQAEFVGQRPLTHENKLEYYDSWLPLAIHVAVSVPQIQTKEALAKHFNLPVLTIQKTLDFLSSIGVVTEARGKYQVGATSIHLEHDSPLIVRHHTNWRLQSLKSLDRFREDNFHYSGVYSLSEHDAIKIKDKLAQVIQGNLKIVAPSKEEVVYCSLIDFFQIKD